MTFGDHLSRMKLTQITQRQYCLRKSFFPLLAAVQACTDNTYNYFSLPVVSIGADGEGGGGEGGGAHALTSPRRDRGPLSVATPAGTCSAPLLGTSHVDMRKKLHFPKAVTERSRLPLAARCSRSPRE